VGNIISRNQHFDTDFASWSEVGKLVLGLTDGNFAVWDLRSNETFMSQKHFSGKLKEGITCGAWGPEGEVLALGSANQLKVSRPMSSASWEHTAAKLHQPHKVSPYPYPSPNPFPSPTPDTNPQP
jgi:WD40 repeat protein